MSIHLIRQFYSLAGSGRFGEALEFFAEAAVIEFFGPASNPLSGRHEGREGIQRFFGLIGDTFEVQLFEPQEFIDAGDTVVVLGRERSTVKRTGRTFDVPWIQVWRCAGNRIVKLTDFFETGTMAEAIVNP